LAILATQMQLAVALEVLRLGPTDPRYAWACGFLRTSTANALAAIKDPKERTRRATEVRQTHHVARCRRAAKLRAADLTASAIAEQMAVEEGHPHEPFDERAVRRWYKAGMSSD
jgi:hypothetical protein